MTERLSPSQWRDLATFWAYWVGDAKVSKMMLDHAGHMALSPEDLRDRADTAQPRASSKHGYFSDGYVAGWEAARREAEAKELGRTARDAAHEGDPRIGHPIVEREGPGSADAPILSAAEASRRLMNFIKVPLYDKPAPAADAPDDQADFLRARARHYMARHNGTDMTLHDDATAGYLSAAADRIEALQARVARLTEALREARIMVASWGAYANDYSKDKHDLAGDLAEIDAALSNLEAEARKHG